MTTKKVKWVKEWFLGYDKRHDEYKEKDWVKRYKSEYGVIETEPIDNYRNEYSVTKDGIRYWFSKLALAKEFLVDGKETYFAKEPIKRHAWQIKLHHTYNYGSDGSRKYNSSYVTDVINGGK